MAEQFPNDYNGLLVGAPAIHWDRFQAYQIWPQVAMFLDTGAAISSAKTTLATNAAVASCDVVNGVHEGFIQNPYACTYNPANDPTVTTSTCTSSNNTCLTPAEAGAIQKIWQGATNTSGKVLWPGVQRGASLSGDSPARLHSPSQLRSRSIGSISIRSGIGIPSPMTITKRSSTRR